MRASQDKKTWVDARAVCQTEGGELAEIQDPHTNAFVAGNFIEKNYSIGLRFYYS